MSWTPAHTPPELVEGAFAFRLSSKPVLGVCRDGKQMVVYACRDETELGEPVAAVRWLSDCSEGWDVTNRLAYWQELPSIAGLAGVASI